MNIKDEKRAVELEYNLICDFIKLRHELVITQKEMANASGTVREIVGVLESRKKHPQINTLIRILEPFGYTLLITKTKEDISERNNKKQK